MKLSLTGRLLLVAVLLSSVLTGCGLGATPVPYVPPPTQDPATIMAGAVATVQAQFTEEALRNPSATPEPTATTAPTETPVPPTFTPLPQPTATQGVPPTATIASLGPLSGKAVYTTTYPGNKREYIPNEKFGLAVGFLNTGTITWEPTYVIKLTGFEGEITVQTESELGKSVAPGEKAEFNMWAFGSETLGKHVWYFQVYNANGGAIPGAYASFTYTSK